MFDVWDWFDYELHTTSGKTFMSSTMFNDLTGAIDDAIERSIRTQDTVESIDIFCTESDY